MEVTEAKSSRDWKAYYLRVWKALLLEFRGWSDAEVEDWAKRNNYLQGDEMTDGWISHDPVARYIVREVFPNALFESEMHGSARVEMGGDMESALWPSSADWIEPADADWPRIRREVARVIADWEIKVRIGYEHEEGEFTGGVIQWESLDLPKIAN